VKGMVAERLAVADIERRGVVLDGFPRSVTQAERLASLLAPRPLDLAIHLDVPRSVAVERLLARRRTDDTPETIAHRMADDERASGPLLTWLHERGVLTRVDGLGTESEIEERMAAALQAARVLDMVA
jgi:adenylate kinase